MKEAICMHYETWSTCTMQDFLLGNAIVYLFKQWRSEGGGGVGVFKPPRNSEGPSKSCQTQPNCENCYKLLNIGRQHSKMFGKKVSKILKLPSVRNCFTLAMTNKLIVIINSLKVPKIKKILLYGMKFLVPNYSCLQNPWQGGKGLPPPDPRSLCPHEFVEPPPNKIPGYATVFKCVMRYEPDDDHLGPKHVAVKITRSTVVLTFCAY